VSTTGETASTASVSRGVGARATIFDAVGGTGRGGTDVCFTGGGSTGA
jgi:hypothetical protein